jgi:uncharacterized protein
MSEKEEKKMRTLRMNCRLLAAASFLIASAGCSTDQVPTGSPVAGIPNPASVHCIEQGGTLEIRKGPEGGETGFCVFADGSECEEWALFRGECEKGSRRPEPRAP